jgi:hypothetical protein
MANQDNTTKLNDRANHKKYPNFGKRLKRVTAWYAPKVNINKSSPTGPLVNTASPLKRPA